MAVLLKHSKKKKKKRNNTIAVSSSAIRRVPVTRMKMMKILMILSRDRSRPTIICTRGGVRRHRDRTG